MSQKLGGGFFKLTLYIFAFTTMSFTCNAITSPSKSSEHGTKFYFVTSKSTCIFSHFVSLHVESNMKIIK